MAIHLVAEFLEVDARKISRVEEVREILDRVISQAELRAITSSYHQFEPSGVSCVYLLHESHLSVHTWPEYGYVALDIFSCDSDDKTLKSFELLKEEFSPQVIKKNILRQDLYEQALKLKQNQRLAPIP